jgi:hypothetical protein
MRHDEDNEEGELLEKSPTKEVLGYSANRGCFILLSQNEAKETDS